MPTRSHRLDSSCPLGIDSPTSLAGQRHSDGDCSGSESDRRQTILGSVPWPASCDYRGINQPEPERAGSEEPCHKRLPPGRLKDSEEDLSCHVSQHVDFRSSHDDDEPEPEPEEPEPEALDWDSDWDRHSDRVTRSLRPCATGGRNRMCRPARRTTSILLVSASSFSVRT
eukprot:2207372-Rhodomonas_salina.1